MDLKKILADLEANNPAQPLYLQAAKEVLETIEDFVNKNPKYDKYAIVERLLEPERIIQFKITWVDDNGKIHVNRGYRVQHNMAIGPYKGGIRFHPSVNVDSMKFLAFEQTFKNSLTTLPMGGGKGGSDFDPQGKSENEMMRFCQSFMTELQKYIGPETDVPAGDIGVGAREVGFMYGQYKRIRDEHVGVLTGKSLNWGGSLIRPEATGFGSIYFLQAMLKAKKDSLKGKKIAVSGFGNVAWGAVLKLEELGGKVIAISGPDGYILDEDGVTGDKVDYMRELLATRNNVVAPYATKYPKAKFIAGKKPWELKVDIAIPCAIQNELNLDDAKQLAANGCQYVVETSNMGCTADAIYYLQSKKISFAPGKAANAGGVATSGLEMTQNSMKLSWRREEVDEKLHQIMSSIHENCLKYGTEKDGYINYVKGANIAGFIKVADAMIEQGVAY
ncbi:MAG TPA: NADP-specific glutamate dehydrogenase [Bacteroidales bacterium]|jgi:glutamate dehydrogenase (NADP+)|nr:NADP-specific glutamate dehydrogenase [Bacteroidales bacterium]HOF15407.1 NADP-specific glutamate dehydrogenase [Bacteroidales bacterium]HON19945.1 NADP-specific glutamate dehydrogenase [Bacteroidales bacterium]HOR81171.1 NADP-specific glutamate dehydrogenase [Bacteroidales bacterium]HPJ90707.1 NADP-specific glutamate dehydrogenase [Bacteroidales bacterium]